MKRSHGFLKFDGIEGVATEVNHKGWVNIKSCSFSMNQHNNDNYSTKLPTTKPPVTVSNMAITRLIDESSSQIMAASGKGILSDKCFIEFLKDSHRANVSVYYELSDARITNYSVNINEEGNWQETLTLSFSVIHFKYTPFFNEEEKKSPSSYNHKLQNQN